MSDYKAVGSSESMIYLKTKGERRYCSNRQPQAGIVAPAWLLIASGKKKHSQETC